MEDVVISKRDLLRARLLDVAEAQIAEGGIVALKARELASGAGCALGAIYHAYGDLGELAVEVNRRTLDQMTAHMEAAASALRKSTPLDVLITLALAYLDYAEQQAPRWNTLLAVGVPETDEAPGFLDASAPLITLFAIPLAELHPDRSGKKNATAARTLFSALHGLVVLGLEPRLSVLPRDKLETRITRLVTTLAAQSDSF